MFSEIQNDINNIISNRDMGASQLAKAAIEVIEKYVTTYNTHSIDDLNSKLSHLCDHLTTLRPSMIAISNRVREFQKRSQQIKLQDIEHYKKQLITLCHQIITESQNAKSNIYNFASHIIKKQKTFMLHSFSSTLQHVFNMKKSKKIFVTESRPLCEGVTLAESLNQIGHHVTLITDMESGTFIPQCDSVWVGADTFFTDGTVINKMGTFILSLLAKYNNIPFYVVTEWDKRTPSTYNHHHLHLEEKPGSEVYTGSANFNIKNIYFDITPPQNITQFITEKGVFTPSELTTL